MRINYNVSAAIANKHLLGIEDNLSASMERLSSGLKINHSKDNPAGMAISNKMKAQIDGLNRASQNASDGISVIQIADGALSETTSILQRMRELSVQAASDATMTPADKEAIQKEITSLKDEVDRISTDTEYNSKTLLDGSLDTRVYTKNATRVDISDHVKAGQYQLSIDTAATQAGPVTANQNYNSTAPVGASGTMSINGSKVEIEADFVNEFILCQNKWRLFSGENIRLGESSIVLSKCVQVLSFLSEENKVAFTEKIEVETAIDVAFWLEYVKDHYVKSKLLNILMNAQKEKLLEGIYFFPTLQHAVDNLLELCFIESESQEENSKEVEKMLDFVQYALKDFEEALSHKPESVREDYKEWKDSAYCRVLLLKNQKDEILSSQHLFYKGIVWLNSNQLEEVQEAKKIFAQNSENSVSWRSNYLIARFMAFHIRLKNKNKRRKYYGLHYIISW